MLEYMTLDELRKHHERLFELADAGHRGSDLGAYGNKVWAEIRKREVANAELHVLY